MEIVKALPGVIRARIAEFAGGRLRGDTIELPPRHDGQRVYAGGPIKLGDELLPKQLGCKHCDFIPRDCKFCEYSQNVRNFARDDHLRQRFNLGTTEASSLEVATWSQDKQEYTKHEVCLSAERQRGLPAGTAADYEPRHVFGGNGIRVGHNPLRTMTTSQPGGTGDHAMTGNVGREGYYTDRNDCVIPRRRLKYAEEAHFVEDRFVPGQGFWRTNKEPEHFATASADGEIIGSKVKHSAPHAHVSLVFDGRGASTMGMYTAAMQAEPSATSEIDRSAAVNGAPRDEAVDALELNFINSNEALMVKLTIEPVRRRDKSWAAVRDDPDAGAADIEVRIQACVKAEFPRGAVRVLRMSFLYEVCCTLHEELILRAWFPAVIDEAADAQPRTAEFMEVALLRTRARAEDPGYVVLLDEFEARLGEFVAAKHNAMQDSFSEHWWREHAHADHHVYARVQTGPLKRFVPSCNTCRSRYGTSSWCWDCMIRGRAKTGCDHCKVRKETPQIFGSSAKHDSVDRSRLGLLDAPLSGIYGCGEELPKATSELPRKTRAQKEAFAKVHDEEANYCLDCEPPEERLPVLTLPEIPAATLNFAGTAERQEAATTGCFTMMQELARTVAEIFACGPQGRTGRAPASRKLRITPLEMKIMLLTRWRHTANPACKPRWYGRNMYRSMCGSRNPRNGKWFCSWYRPTKGDAFLTYTAKQKPDKKAELMLHRQRHRGVVAVDFCARARQEAEPGPVHGPATLQQAAGRSFNTPEAETQPAKRDLIELGWSEATRRFNFGFARGLPSCMTKWNSPQERKELTIIFEGGIRWSVVGFSAESKRERNSFIVWLFPLDDCAVARNLLQHGHVSNGLPHVCLPWDSEIAQRLMKEYPHAHVKEHLAMKADTWGERLPAKRPRYEGVQHRAAKRHLEQQEYIYSPPVPVMPADEWQLKCEAQAESRITPGRRGQIGENASRSLPYDQAGLYADFGLQGAATAYVKQVLQTPVPTPYAAAARWEFIEHERPRWGHHRRVREGTLGVLLLE